MNGSGVIRRGGIDRILLGLAIASVTLAAKAAESPGRT